MITSIDPRTGRTLGRFRSTRIADVQASVSIARVAQRVWWLQKSKPDRIAAVRGVEHAMMAGREKLVDAASSETGLPRSAVASGFDSAIRGFSHYIERYERLSDIEFPLDPLVWKDVKAKVVFEPHGVVGQIGVWNYPIWQTLITVIPALLVGNAIVYKPSEYVTMTGGMIADLVHEGGVPQDVFVLITGGKSVGRALIRSDCDALVFTGGLRTGRQIIKRAGVKPLLLELSGNDAGIVCEDADLETAARGVATGTFSRAGQVCIRVKRVYVNRAIADRFLKRLVEIASGVDVAAQIGPLIRESAREKVHEVVQRAVSGGAKLLCGGKKVEGPGYFYEPTVLVMKSPAEVMTRETFGPVCSVMVVENDDEAVALANGSEYGLGATIWTSDLEKAARLSSRLEVGNVWVNEWGRALTGGEYFQGWKSSGIASSQERLMMFLRKKSVIVHNRSEPRESWFR